MLVRKARAAFDVSLAALAVARARRVVSARPVGALVERTAESFSQSVQPERESALSPEDRRHADRWGAAVDRALRWLPGDSACLVRASALRELVVRHGLPRAVVRIGVRRGPSGFEAHAWVEQDGTPIAEPEALRGGFSSLQGVTLR